MPVKTFKPRGSARELFHLRNKEVLVSGPAGTGKTRACLEKLNAVALKYPGMRGLIVRKTARSLPSSCLAEFKQNVIDQQLLMGSVKWYGGSGSTPASFQYDNGSTIEVGGMDNPTKIMSTQYDFIFVEEATELALEDWQALVIRARNGHMPYQQVLGACNPGPDTHFLKLRSDSGVTVLLNATHEENPRLFGDDGELTEYGRSYIEEGLERLTGVYYKRYRQGLWVGAEGQIFDEFDPAVHVIEAMPKGWESWTRYWSVDFGFTNPLVVQFWAEDPDGRLYLYRELYQTQQLVEDVCRRILDVVAPEGNWIEPKPRVIVCDHDAEDRATFERHMKMGTRAADKNVSRGLQTTASRFRVQKDGKPRLYFLKSALHRRDSRLLEAKRPTCTVEELPGYIWSPGKEAPVKENDHGCDAMRYVVMERDTRGITKVRFA